VPLPTRCAVCRLRSCLGDFGYARRSRCRRGAMGKNERDGGARPTARTTSPRCSSLPGGDSTTCRSRRHTISPVKTHACPLAGGNLRRRQIVWNLQRTPEVDANRPAIGQDQSLNRTGYVPVDLRAEFPQVNPGGGAEGIRTPDPLDANEVRYRTALQPPEPRQG
jgi:hypothetical protein